MIAHGPIACPPGVALVGDDLSVVDAVELDIAPDVLDRRRLDVVGHNRLDARNLLPVPDRTEA
jgi:hypothetical protein